MPCRSASPDRRRLRALPAFEIARWLAWAVLSLLIAVLTWPTWTYTPQPGTDQSWQLGLSWAASLGLQWGTDLVFTYGPLGYTLTPMLMPIDQVVVAGFLHVVAATVTVISLHALLSARHVLPPALTVVLSASAAAVVLVAGVGITGMVPGGRMSGMVVAAVPLAFCVLMTRSTWPVITSGLLLGILGHQKLSEAVLVVGLVAIAALARRSRRDLGLLLGLGLGSWLAVWLVAGQAPAHLPAYLASALQIVSGYAAAMAIETPEFGWTYGPAAVAATLLLVQARWSTRDRPSVERISVLAMVAWFLWVSFRQGFVRHDVHDMFFFAAVVVMSVTLLAMARSARAFALGIIVCALPVLVLTIYGLSFVGLVDRRDSVTAASRAWNATFDMDAREAAWHSALDGMREVYELPVSLVDELGTRPTAADPGDISALAPTGVVWDPVPAFQLYAAYTPALDDLNARSLEARPRQILRASPPSADDERFPSWESPHYQAVVYCRYDPVMQTGRWLLLRPAASDRCGGSHDPVTVSASPGLPIEVPARPGMITLASISYQRSIADTLANLVFKGREHYVTYGNGTWRMPYVPDARDLMLNAPVPHAAFPDLPTAPYPTLVLDAPATIEFSFVDVSAADV